MCEIKKGGKQGLSKGGGIKITDLQSESSRPSVAPYLPLGHGRQIELVVILGA